MASMKSKPCYYPCLECDEKHPIVVSDDVCKCLQCQREFSEKELQERLPTIIGPEEDLDPRLRALSGRWSGRWGGALASRLIVERIDAEEATVVYSWGDHPSGSFSRGWLRTKAHVLAGGGIRFGEPEVFTFEIDDEEQALRGTREDSGGTSMIVMHRDGPQS